jgi:hypothetical protein
MHRGEIIADLSGADREGSSEASLLQRFAELKYTAELRYTMAFSVATAATLKEN